MKDRDYNIEDRKEARKKLENLNEALINCGFETDLDISEYYIILELLDHDLCFSATALSDFEIKVNQ